MTVVLALSSSESPELLRTRQGLGVGVGGRGGGAGAPGQGVEAGTRPAANTPLSLLTHLSD